MIRSMTGYGEAERESAVGTVRLELKTVNHRFFNSSVKTPHGFDRYERDVVEVLKAHLSRGHVSAYLSIGKGNTRVREDLQIDVEKARGYSEALNRLQDDLDVPGTVDLALLARFSDIFRAPELDRAEVVGADLVRELTEEAALAAVALREAEGRQLEADLRERLEAMRALLERVEQRAPERLVAERDRLRSAVAELSEQVEVDEDRLAREIAYLAERWDIAEEIVRFRSHAQLFAEALDGEVTEPVGKRLGFLVQEMHREANTIGSKANDTEISHASVGLKEEIERLREQVENVE